MTKQSTTTRMVLADRSSNGVEVTLVWAQRDGIDEVVVCVRDIRTGEHVEIPADPSRALDVYHHPFAYGDRGAIDFEYGPLAA
jgi:hypothetical protein